MSIKSITEKYLKKKESERRHSKKWKKFSIRKRYTGGERDFLEVRFGHIAYRNMS